MKSLLSFVVTSLVLSTGLLAQPSEKLSALRAEAREIEGRIRVLEAANPKLAAAEREAIDATKAREARLDSHPELKEINAAMAAAMKKLTAAITSKDKAAQEAATREQGDLRARRSEQAGKIADLAPLFAAASEKSAAFQNEKEAFGKSTPEAKQLTERLAEIRQEIRKERDAR